MDTQWDSDYPMEALYHLICEMHNIKQQNSKWKSDYCETWYHFDCTIYKYNKIVTAFSDQIFNCIHYTKINSNYRRERIHQKPRYMYAK